MKKNLLAVMAALAMASCSQNVIDEIDNGGQTSKAEIQFGYSPVGRATVMITDNFEHFKVSAYTHTEANYTPAITTTDLIPTTLFNYDKTNSIWKAENNAVFYWPTSGNVTFFGFSPETITDASYSKTDGAAPTLTYTVNSTIGSQEDVLVTQVTKSTTNDRNNAVSLKFNHALTQVYFKLIGEDTDLSYDVKSITIKGLKDEGTYTYGSGWNTSSDNTTQDYTITLTNTTLTGVADTNAQDAAFTELTANDQLMILMPQELNGATIEVTYAATKGSVEVHSASSAVTKKITGTWNPGDKIAYKLILSGDKMEIKGEVGTDWTTKTPTEETPTNP